MNIKRISFTYYSYGWVFSPVLWRLLSYSLFRKPGTDFTDSFTADLRIYNTNFNS